MPNSEQVRSLIQRLDARSRDGSLKWQRSTRPGALTARLGEFNIQIAPGVGEVSHSSYGTFPDVELTVKKLDGTVVEQIGGIREMGVSHTPIPDRIALAELFNFLSGGNPDLDNLLDLLK